MGDYLPTVRLAADASMVSLILLVQLVIYPAFYTIEAREFIKWHQRYVTTIAFIVVPLMLVQAGCIAIEIIEAADPASVLSALAVLAAWITTFTVSAPCHRELQQVGKDPEIIAKLIRTNWLRTVSWLTVFLVGFVKAFIRQG